MNEQQEFWEVEGAAESGFPLVRVYCDLPSKSAAEAAAVSLKQALRRGGFSGVTRVSRQSHRHGSAA